MCFLAQLAELFIKAGQTAVCVCVWVSTRLEQIATTAHLETCNLLIACPKPGQSDLHYGSKLPAGKSMREQDFQANWAWQSMQCLLVFSDQQHNYSSLPCKSSLMAFYSTVVTLLLQICRLLQCSAKHCICYGKSIHPSIRFCLSVTRRYCVKTRERRRMRSSPLGSPGSLVFWCQKWLMGDDPSR